VRGRLGGVGRGNGKINPSQQQRKKDIAMTHLKRLLSKKACVPAQGPQAMHAQIMEGVGLGPHKARAGPVCADIVCPMLPCVEGKEFTCKEWERCESPYDE